MLIFCIEQVMSSIILVKCSYLTYLTGSKWRKEEKEKKISGGIGNILLYVCKSQGRIPG